jgi:hypothetical protein
MHPTLVLLAAGMSTRYGRLKQLEPVGPSREALMDYSVFDARNAGFSRVVLVIRRELEDAFRRHLRGRWPADVKVVFHYQELDDLPGVRRSGLSPRGLEEAPDYSRHATEPPMGGREAGRPLAQLLSRRSKPWGTAHAILTARHLLPGPFAVINADDFYGPSAFTRAARALDLLSHRREGGMPLFGLLTYTLADTLSGHGGVSRGICRLEGLDWLAEVREVLEIQRDSQEIRGKSLSGEEVRLRGWEPTSTNFWLLSPDIFPLLDVGFRRFLGRMLGGSESRAHARGQPCPGAWPQAEFLLPSEMNRILAEGRGRVRVTPGGETFLGITHPEDRKGVVEGLERLVRQGRYPKSLWRGDPAPGQVG